MAASKTAGSTPSEEGLVVETTPLLDPSVGNDHSKTTSNNPPNGHVAKQPQAPDASLPHTNQTTDEEKPFPRFQILVLCYASIVDPVAFFIILPYINEMVERVGHQLPENVGFWTGTIESLFSLVQMLLIIFYGRIADRIGRKPVLVFSLAGIAAASALFGLSATLWQMVVFRCLAGLFAGCSVTIRAMISENCTKTTQAKAFGWFMFARNLGILVGPAIGGILANPASQYSLFEHIAFFKEYPYALPGFVSGIFCLSTAILSFVCLDETLPTKTSNEDGQAEPEMSTWELLKAPGTGVVLYIYSHVMLQALAYTAVQPVALYTPVHLGGFQFSPKQISLALALAGASQAIWMIFAFPYLQRKTSTGSVLRGCCIAWPIEMACYPIANELLRADFRAAFWTLGAVCVFFGSGIAMSFACVQLCLNDVAPSPSTLATLNAVALTVSSGLRALAPVGMTSVYAVGVKGGWLHGHLGWFCLLFMGLLMNVSVRWLPASAEGNIREAAKVDDNEEE